MKPMKPILIILSLLILSSPLSAGRLGILYKHKTSTGYVWETILENSVAKYIGGVVSAACRGSCENRTLVDVPNGFGILDSGDGEKYIGEWKSGKKNGHGTHILCDGCPTFKGYFYDDDPWNARIYTSNGRIDGMVVKGKIHYCAKRPEFCK